MVKIKWAGLDVIEILRLFLCKVSLKDYRTMLIGKNVRISI